MIKIFNYKTHKSFKYFLNQRVLGFMYKGQTVHF